MDVEVVNALADSIVGGNEDAVAVHRCFDRDRQLLHYGHEVRQLDRWQVHQRSAVGSGYHQDVAREKRPDVKKSQYIGVLVHECSGRLARTDPAEQTTRVGVTHGSARLRGMSQSPVNLTSGIPETVIDPLGPELEADLEAATNGEDEERRRGLMAILVKDPTCLEAWARLAEIPAEPIERYAYARVGYHRGLDTLRKSGWRGSGYVRWSAPSNRGFLRALENLRRCALEIGERVEAERCDLFLRQLDPDWHGLPTES